MTLCGLFVLNLIKCNDGKGITMEDIYISIMNRLKILYHTDDNYGG